MKWAERWRPVFVHLVLEHEPIVLIKGEVCTSSIGALGMLFLSFSHDLLEETKSFLPDGLEGYDY